jgi:hypothetical protein
MNFLDYFERQPDGSWKCVKPALGALLLASPSLLHELGETVGDKGHQAARLNSEGRAIHADPCFTSLARQLAIRAIKRPA